MKKRVLGLLTAAAMLFSALPVFAVGEIPSDDNLVWYNDGTRASDFNAPAEGKREVDGNAIKMTATYNGDKVLNYQIQKTDLKFSKSSDISAILSFKIKAGQTNKHFNMALRHEWKEKEVVEGKEQEETKGSEITLFAMSADGKLAYSGNGDWIGNRSGFSGDSEYTPGTWYDVSMVLNKTERKIYYYIDGKLYGTAAVADDKFAFDSQQLILKSTVTIGSNLSPELGEANFWLDDIMWLSGSDNSFYAFTDSDEYSISNPKVNIKLTEQAKDADLTGVTVHKVRDNSEVNATAALTSARNIEVKINGTLSPEEEYRIDIPSLTSVTGKKIYNQSVYFMSGEYIIFSDDFSEYDTSVKNGNPAGEFYKPVDWYTNTNWADQYSTLKPLETTQSDGTTGKVAEFKKQNNDKEPGTYGWAAIYRAFGNDKKINSGILTVEYDVKAMKAQNVEEAGKPQSQLLLGVYKDALTDEEYTYPDSTDSNDLVKNVIGREAIENGTVTADNVNNNLQFVGGVQGGAICRFMDNKSLTDGYYHLDGGKDAVWNIDDFETLHKEWYKVKVTFDYINKTISTNVVGVKNLGSYPVSNFGIENGISAISFGSSAAESAFTKDIYLDNVSVVHTENVPKVSKVRFINGDGVESGITNSISTLNEKVKITFANGAIDAESVNGITLKDNSGKTIELKDGSLNADRTVYTATLGDLMKVNTDYTLSVSGLTSSGAPVEDYTAAFNTEQTGHFIVSKPYIKGEIADNGEITIGIKAINTTGEGKAVTFSYAKYSGNQMTECMLEPSQSVGGDKPALYAKEYNITLSPDEAAKLTEIKAFAWGDITSVVPLTDFAAVTKTVSGN